MPGVQVQYVSETGPDSVSLSPDSEPQAARAVAAEREGDGGCHEAAALRVRHGSLP
ncbi:hypothetical protein QF034_007674 [Streptomyces africanus]|uniref:Uncharacterized protein n=1 Tax=Streptomyces africanus TaxID=231024 RepID=A0ABU0R1B1_9ACTN|nr:hypothetical protein [Streptomyces africanus]